MAANGCGGSCFGVVQDHSSPELEISYLWLL